MKKWLYGVSLVIGFAVPLSVAAESAPGDLFPEEGLNPEDIQSLYIGQSYHSQQVVLGARADGFTATAIYDRATDRIYVDTAYASFDVGLGQAALQAAKGNSALANSMASDLRSSFLTQHSFEITVGSIGLPSYTPPSGIPEPCDLSPCDPWAYMIREGFMESYLGFRVWDPRVDPWWEMAHTDEEVEEDKAAFNRAKDHWCDQEASDSMQILAGLLSGTPACITGETNPFSASVCAGSVVTILDGFRSDASEKCHQKYPGPGAWHFP
ncbi:hypothetical protein FKV24_004990 [Lysobacter maris]|uniref:Uncharacterized protein n=1 Tax=Marilutibacter maris TaxID=1605891 RepID=A0A508AW48_9GAMM|nr:hypothetical protein [Lysobacter maris]KAB8195628.1 hypothetical protein FKV24_004990 [Lysobacter maris]